MKSTAKRIELDWGKLFGFRQVKSAQTSPRAKLARRLIDSKLGGKQGIKSRG